MVQLINRGFLAGWNRDSGSNYYIPFFFLFYNSKNVNTRKKQVNLNIYVHNTLSSSILSQMEVQIEEKCGNTLQIIIIFNIKTSGCLIGSSITLFFIFCLSHPPIISNVESGTLSTFINVTSGSTFVGSILCQNIESDRRATLVSEGVPEISTSSSMDMRNFPS